MLDFSRQVGSERLPANAPISALAGQPDLAHGIQLAILPLGPNDEFWLDRREEECLSAAAVPKRRREFAAGRACAATAMADLGIAPAPLLAGADCLPTWPAGVVGSISHSRSLAGAAATLWSERVLALGLDIEPVEPLDEDLICEVCVPSELAFLEQYDPKDRGILAKAIFCAKEAAYKCQYPISRKLFGFESLAIEINLRNREFAAAFQEDIGPYRAGDLICGRLWISRGHFFAMSVAR